MSKKSLLLTALVTALVASPSARAAIYAYEGFNGYADGFLNGQMINSNTIGLNTSTVITAAGATDVNSFNATGLTFGNMPVSGGSALYNSAIGAASYIGFAYNGATASGTLYSSYLVNIQSPVNATSTVGLRVNTTASTGGGTQYFATFGDTVNNANTGLRYDTGNVTTITSSEQTLDLNTTYVVVGRFTNVGAALSAETPGVGTLFVLTVDQYMHFQIGGFSDGALDGAAIGSGAEEVFSRVSTPDVTAGTFGLADGNGLQFGPGNGMGTALTYAYDEMRWGQSLNDVLAVVPEPGTITLLAAGGLLCLLTLRRSAKRKN